jgi:hypothetical protein
MDQDGNTVTNLWLHKMLVNVWIAKRLKGCDYKKGIEMKQNSNNASKLLTYNNPCFYNTDQDNTIY